MDTSRPPARIALVGDHDPAVVAHRAIPLALGLAAGASGPPVDWAWVHTSTLVGDVTAHLEMFDGIWCVPASPYANTDGALAAIRVARERQVPFLGTCGGFQHALLEYAGAVWGVAAPAHAELDPSAADPVIAPLTCALVEQAGTIRFEPGSRLLAIYGSDDAVEGYHCSYGLNPACAAGSPAARCAWPPAISPATCGRSSSTATRSSSRRCISRSARASTGGAIRSSPPSWTPCAPTPAARLR